jgi:hypothetical protein
VKRAAKSGPAESQKHRMAQRQAARAGPRGPHLVSDRVRPRPRWWHAASSLAMALACTGETPPVQSGPLSGFAARVGPELVAKETIGRIAAAQNLGPEEARHRAIAVALFAAAARDDLDERAIRHAENRALAWALLGEIWAEAQVAPIRGDELAEATASHWTRYDRPAAHRTIHALVKVEGGARDDARALAERIREAVAPAAALARAEPAPNLDEEAFLTGSGAAQLDPAQALFERSAKEAAPGDGRLVVEMLPPVARDGTIVATGTPPENRRFDPIFAEAAADLQARGALSEVVESPFGFHVVMLLGIVAEKRVSAAERRIALRAEIMRVRGLRAQRALLERLSRERPIDVARNHAAILEQALGGARAIDGSGATP